MSDWAKCPHCGVWVHPKIAPLHDCPVVKRVWLHPNVARFFGQASR